MLQIIALLLFLILLVMLLGSGAVMGLLGVVLAIGVVAAILVLVSRGIFSLLAEVSDSKNKGQAWLFLVPGAIGGFGCIPVVLIAALSAGTFRGEAFQSSLEAIPYYWVPIALMISSPVVMIVETAPRWIPKVPGVIAGFFAGVGKMLVAPVTYPIEGWSEIKAKNASGEKLGFVLSSWTMIGSVFCGFFVFIIGASIGAALAAATAFGGVALYQAL